MSQTTRQRTRNPFWNHRWTARRLPGGILAGRAWHSSHSAANVVDDVLEREDVGGVTVARVMAPLLRDDKTTEGLFGELFAVLDEPGGRGLVLNLGPVEYVGSVVVGKLAVLSRKGRGRLALCRLTPTVERMLEAAHLADVLPIFADEESAVRSFT